MSRLPPTSQLPPPLPLTSHLSPPPTSYPPPPSHHHHHHLPRSCGCVGRHRNQLWLGWNAGNRILSVAKQKNILLGTFVRVCLFVVVVVVVCLFLFCFAFCFAYSFLFSFCCLLCFVFAIYLSFFAFATGIVFFCCLRSLQQNVFQARM